MTLSAIEWDRPAAVALTETHIYVLDPAETHCFLHASVAQKDFQPVPLPQGVIDGLAEKALAQMLAAGFEV